MVLFIFNKFNILMEWKKQWGPFKSFETWKKAMPKQYPPSQVR